MKCMIAPGKGKAVEKWTEDNADQHTEQCCEETPQTYQTYDVIESFLIPMFVSLRNLAHCTHAKPQVSRIRHQFYAGIEKRNHSHTLRTEDDGHQFVAHHAHEDIQSLYPAKDACIF